MILVTLDFETAYGKHPETGENITLSKMTTEEYVRHKHFKIHGVGVKWEDRPPVYWYGDLIYDSLPQLPWHEIALLGQNTLFDGFILHEHFGIHPAMYLDTKSMTRLLFPQERASLKYIAQRLKIGEKGDELVNTMHKWELTDEEQRALGGYCATNQDSDCNLTYRAFQIMKKYVPVEELKLIDLTIRMYCDPVLELDKGVLEDHLYDVTNNKEQLLASVGQDIKALRSNPQFADLLRAHGVEPPTKISKTTGKETYAFAKTDEGMTALLDHPKPEVQALAMARMGVKSSIEESRTQRFLGIAERGPLPVALQIYGAANTLRWSALEKQNLQNLPRGGELRRSICAPPGYRLVVADLEQIEARVLAWIAGQDDLLEDFAAGKDVYCGMATRVFQRDITKADKLERQLGKALVLGCGYGMGWLRFGGFLASGPLGADPILFDVPFSETLGVALYDHVLNDSGRIVATPKIDMELCAKTTTKLHGDDLLAHAVCSKFLIDMYRGLNKQIKAYWRTGEKILRAMHAGEKKEFGVLTTSQDRLHLPNGTALHYKNLRMIETDDEDGGTQWVYDGLKGRGRDTQYIYGAKLVENIVQALSRIILAYGMLEISKRYRVVLTVHDEVVCVVREEQADAALVDCCQIMSVPLPWCKDLPLAASGDVAMNYAEAK